MPESSDRTAAIEQANEEFPAYWKRLQDFNGTRSHPDMGFPRVLDLKVGEVSHDHGTEANVTLLIQGEDGNPQELDGAYFSNSHGSTCFFTGCPAELRTFAEEFTANLIGNVGYEVGIYGIEDWKKLQA